jgi:hypothetical protein
MVTDTKRNHPSIPQPSASKNFEETKAKLSEKHRTMQTENKNAQNLTSFSKTNNNKKPFRMLIHHHTMKTALIKTNPKTKLSTGNQQQPATRRGQRN